MMKVQQQSQPHTATLQLGKAGVVVAGAALVGAMVWFIATGAGGRALVVDSDWGGQQVVGLGSVVVTSAVVAIAGLLAGALVWRRATRPRRLWRALAWTICIVSLLGIGGAVSTPVLVGLAALHLGVGATVAVGVERAYRTS